MKRFLPIILAIVCVCSHLVGCSSTETRQPKPVTGETTEPTQSPEEAEVLKILMLGNSHSNDTFWLLPDVFAEQMPDQKVFLGFMYYSGCTIDQHITFIKDQESVYNYYWYEDGKWKVKTDTEMETGLCDQAWDIIAFQSGRGDSDSTFNLKGRRTLEKLVKARVEEPFKMIWHITWPSPSDPTFFSPTYPVQPPSGWVDFLESNYNHDTFKQFESMVTTAKANLLEDETYDKVISTGGGIMYAHAALNVPQTDLWRDYTHLSDYGRLVAAYTFYAQFTGNAISEVNIDVIPAAMRQKRFREEGDLVITEEMKQVIITAANHALQDPWTVPAKPAAN